MTKLFEEKTEMLQEKFFSSLSQADISDILNSFISLMISFNLIILQEEMKQAIQ
jgi:hypothetical protein